MNAAMEKVRILGRLPVRLTYSLMVGRTRAEFALAVQRDGEQQMTVEQVGETLKIADANASRSSLGRSSVGAFSLKSAWDMRRMVGSAIQSPTIFMTRQICLSSAYR